MQDIIRHESGLEFEHSDQYRSIWAGGTGLNCFGQLLNSPQFTNVEGLKSLKLDTVRMSKVYVQGADGSIVEEPSYSAVISAVSGKVYSVPSAKYTPVQDADMVKPFVNVAEERRLKTIGRFDGVGSGQTRGHIVLANPEFRVRVLNAYPDDIMLGVNMTNSYDTSAGVRMEVFGVRMVCSNYCLWGNLLGYVYQQHMNFDAEHMADRIGEFLNGIVDKTPVLSNIAEKALNTPVITAEVEDLLWAIRMPKRGIESLTRAPSEYCPEMKTLGLNAWTLYNASMAYLTWAKKDGARYIETTVDYATGALDLLTASHDRLIERGREIREKAEERAKENDYGLKVVALQRKN